MTKANSQDGFTDPTLKSAVGRNTEGLSCSLRPNEEEGILKAKNKQISQPIITDLIFLFISNNKMKKKNEIKTIFYTLT